MSNPFPHLEIIRDLIPALWRKRIYLAYAFAWICNKVLLTLEVDTGKTSAILAIFAPVVAVLAAAHVSKPAEK